MTCFIDTHWKPTVFWMKMKEEEIGGQRSGEGLGGKDGGQVEDKM